MKTFILAFISLVSFVSADVTTFDGHKFRWGWSDEKTYSREKVTDFLDQNPDIDPLKIQAGIDKITSAEFLWKVTPDEVDRAMASGSTFMTGEKATLFVLTFRSDGSGEITLYSKDRIVGRARCWTSSIRDSKDELKEFSQLHPGNYKVLHTDPEGYSKEFDCNMPNRIALSGLAEKRGVFIHTGDISGPKKDENMYHGCIRVSNPVGQQFMKVISKGTAVKVVWE